MNNKKYQWVGGGCGVNGFNFVLSDKHTCQKFSCEDTFMDEERDSEVKVLSRNMEAHFDLEDYLNLELRYTVLEIVRKLPPRVRCG